MDVVNAFQGAQDVLGEVFRNLAIAQWRREDE